MKIARSVRSITSRRISDLNVDPADRPAILIAVALAALEHYSAASAERLAVAAVDLESAWQIRASRDSQPRTAAEAIGLARGHSCQP
jgi:hypothetical protein